MAQDSFTVVNTFFPHVADTVITANGKTEAINALVVISNNNYQADAPQATVYDCICKYIAENLAQEGDRVATPELLKRFYYSDKFRKETSITATWILENPFCELHEMQEDDADLGNAPELISYLMEFWHEHVIKRGGECLVTGSGMIRRFQNQQTGAIEYEVTLASNTSMHEADIRVWFALDSTSPGPANWALVLPSAIPLPSPPKFDDIFDIGAAEKEGLFVTGDDAGDEDYIPEDECTPAASEMPSSTPMAPAPRPHVPTSNPRLPSTIPGEPVSVAPLVQPPPPVFSPVRPVRGAPHTPLPPMTLPAGTGPFRRGTQARRYIANAPAFDTALPWNLLADATFEELVIYYPNHVLNHPGLALLFNHYVHRLVGPQWSYVELARRLVEAYGLTDKPSILGGRFRWWIQNAIAELDQSYNASEAPHYHILYRLLQRSNANDVAAFLQRHLRTNSVHALRPFPAVPLREVGAPVRVHPVGNFAIRVQNAVQAWNNNIVDFDDSANPPQVPLSGVLPMVAFLADSTKTWADRVKEKVKEHNESVTPDRFIRPIEYLNQFGKRKFDYKSDDPSHQIWEWYTEQQTVFDHLTIHFTRQQFVEMYWRDLYRDAALWLDIGASTEEWMRWLPAAARLEFDLDGSKKKRVAFEGKFRKSKQMAFEGRLKGINPPLWDESKKDGAKATKSSSVHPDNKKLYLEEKNKFDKWAMEHGRRPITKKRHADASDNDAPSPARPSKRPRREPVASIYSNENHLEQIPEPSQLPAAEPTFVELESLPHTHDDHWLYNEDPNGTRYIVRRVDAGTASGSIPQWWREARVRLLRWAGHQIADDQLNSSFDQGLDVVPDPYVQGRLFQLDGNFSAEPHAVEPAAPTVTAPSSNSWQFGQPLPDNTGDFSYEDLYSNPALPTMDNNGATADPFATVNQPSQEPNFTIPDDVSMGGMSDVPAAEAEVNFDPNAWFDPTGRFRTGFTPPGSAPEPATPSAPRRNRRRSSGGSSGRSATRRSPRNHPGSSPMR